MMKEDELKNYIKFSNYARTVGVSVVTVDNWGKQGKIHTVKIDGSNYVNIKNDKNYGKKSN